MVRNYNYIDLLIYLKSYISMSKTTEPLKLRSDTDISRNLC